MREIAAGDRFRSAGRGVLARPWLLIVLAGVVALVFWIRGTRSEPYTVKATFDSAVSLYSGLDVRVDGLDAGKIEKVEDIGGKAVVSLGIRDKAERPLHVGTKAILRFGSTVGNGTRIIDIVPGPKSNPEIPDGGQIPDQDTVEATEFDDVFNTFDKKTRADLQGTLKGTGDTFGSRSKQLAAAVTQTPVGLQGIGDLANDVDADEPALHAFIANTDRATVALAARRDAVSSLVGNAATTFNAFATHTNGIEQGLDKFPSTADETKTTLRALDTSVGHLNGLITDLKPGASELGSLAVKLRPAMANLKKTVPIAVQTFATARRSSPDITALLAQAQPTSDKAAPALASFAPMASCLRPYAPEATALVTEWSSWDQLEDDHSHIGRLDSYAGAASVTSDPLDPATYTKLTGQGYALIRPPGLTVGKPWFQPECGVNQDGLDPSKDPEVGK